MTLTKTLMKTCVIATTVASLSSCAWFHRAPHTSLNVYSASYLNPSISGHASPVVVSIYQLKSPYAFEQANYRALISNSGKVLGTDLVDKSTYEIRPSSRQTINQPLSPNTQYLGIVAAYRNIDRATWHKVVKVINKKGHHTSVHLDLESEGLVVRKAS